MHTENETSLHRIGFYSVGAKGFLNKIEALEYHQKHGGFLTYHENEHVWSAQNWQKPIEESLPALYARRARQLREKYDYLIVCYSGGADSQCILDTFEAEGLRIDQIVMWHDHALTNNKMSRISAEIFNVAIPTAQEYVKRNPGTRLEIFDMKGPMMEIIERHTSDEMLTHIFASMPSMGQLIRSGAFFYQSPRWRQLVEQGKKVGVVWGIDKTLVWLENNRYVVKFADSTYGRNRIQMLYPDIPVGFEFFYHTPDLPEIVVKGCQVLVQALRSLPTPYKDPFSIPKDSFRVTGIKTPNGVVSLETVNLWLYGKTPSFTLKKAFGTHYFSALDREWILKARNEDHVQQWKTLMLKVQDLHGHFSKIPVLYTRPYIVGRPPSADPK